MLSPSFDSIIETLNNNKLYSFPGGVHPDDKKSLSNTTTIQVPSLPAHLIIPMRQHIGSDGTCCVEVGDKVQKGQILSQSATPFAVPVHAPTSGEIIAIAPHVVAHPSGLTEMCITLKPDGNDTWCDLSPIPNYTEVNKNELINHICQAGISGMGGAGFPTHIKTSTSKPVEFLVLNGIECEPYITSDDRLMREHAWQIRQGLDILAHLINPKAIIVAIEDNKPEALQALNIACQDKEAYRVVSVETKYPAGGEKQLIQVLTGREVPRDGLPVDIGVVMFNVGTCYAVADAILQGKPLVERVVTVTGEAVKQPGNFKALIGTPVAHLLEQAQYNPKKQKAPKVVMGGPMMGFTLSDATIPIIKTTNCLLVPSKKELVDDNAERPCIRCSACADACPASLLPQQMFWHAKAKEYDKAEEYDLFDCIECGACAYVCPSEIPLVHYYRQAKADIRTQRDEKNKAEKAKQRFEARNERLEREKREREEKHRRAKEARLAANQAKSANTDAPAQPASDTKDKVAAALARAKAKKAALQSNVSNQTQPDAKTQESAPVSAVDSSGGSGDASGSDKKAQVAAAIARAKAKKEARAADASEASPSGTTDVDDKKAKIAAAIARAKAKKAAQQSSAPSSDETASFEAKPSEAEHSKSEPAKEAELESTTGDTGVNDTPLSEADQKKARIAAAVAKAKAKKASAKQSINSGAISKASGEERHISKRDSSEAAEVSKNESISTPSNKEETASQEHGSQNHHPQKESTVNSNSGGDVKSAADAKKARIAAAVAKAKAKKAAIDKEKELK
ncbi:electron transport complex subunit RsxC [Alteromonas genovensis]|uniref:Ion-translocating oxidoreductase complex subunit C n=1 Tax=Alteromonas genovensis TaxID=471225 RepID=A0A6N9TJE0_9ALTE|nr:electron transport complex subunit RsxC [Alteromonas genovensis]